MVKLGQYNTLPVGRLVEIGLYLDAGDGLEILMPRRYAPRDAAVGQMLDVFVYQDAEARLIATDEHPVATVGQVGYVQVKSVGNFGAFADWGTSKELFIPFREQTQRMEEGRRYLVYIYIDHQSGRIAGSARLDKWLDNVPPTYQDGQQVDIIVWRASQIGWKVIIDHQHTGMLYHNQIFRELHTGQRLQAWVKTVREDDKIDLSLQPLGYHQMIDSAEAAVLEAINRHGGHLSITDNSTPELIAFELQMSKKSFKKAVGALYRQRRIRLLPDGIELNEEEIED